VGPGRDTKAAENPDFALSAGFLEESPPVTASSDFAVAADDRFSTEHLSTLLNRFR
jgi:hypothetical protein